MIYLIEDYEVPEGVDLPPSADLDGPLDFSTAPVSPFIAQAAIDADELPF